MLTSRICATLAAISSLATTLPAISLPATTTPSKTPAATTPSTTTPSTKSKPAVVNAIAITNIAGIYKAIFDPKLLQKLSASERQSYEEKKVLLDSVRLTVKPDSSYEMIYRKSPRDPKMMTVVGKIKIENQRVSLSVNKIDGKAITNEQRNNIAPGEGIFNLLERGKVWEFSDMPLIKLVRT
jgi:hypothetical protein